MQALAVGFAVMVVYGLFLLIKAMRRLYREGEKKLVFCAIIFMVVAPCLVWLSGLIPEERTNLWTALPTLLLFLLWVCAGYFLESYRKQKEKLRDMGLDQRTQAPANMLLRNTLVLAAGLAIWLYGAFVGIGDRTVEICLLCVSLFLLASSIGTFWKYRKF